MRTRSLLAFLIIFLIGCSSSVSTPGVVDKGYIPVSPSNPYGGANVFLGNEMSTGPLLKNFLLKRGAPTAIKVSEKEMALLYLPEKESFFGTRFKSGRKAYDWIIRGPYAMTRQEYKTVSGLFDPHSNVAHFVVNNRDLTLPLRKPVVIVSTPIVPEVPPAIKPKKKITKTARADPVLSAEEREILPPNRVGSWNSDQRAVYTSKGYADRAENGDLKHVVTQQGETLKKISAWYTGSEKNASQIAVINSLQSNQVLGAGITVLIPEKMLTRALKMPSGY